MEIFFSLKAYLLTSWKMYNPPWQSSGDIGCLKYADWAQGITSSMQFGTKKKKFTLVLGESWHNSCLKAALLARFVWSKGGAPRFHFSVLGKHQEPRWRMQGGPTAAFLLLPCQRSWHLEAGEEESVVWLIQNSRSVVSRGVYGNGTCCLHVRKNLVQGLCHLVLWIWAPTMDY